MPTFEKGMDYSNYQPHNGADFVRYMRDEMGVTFLRLGCQDPAVTWQQAIEAEKVGMPIDVLYCTSTFQLDAARQIARRFNVPRIAVDVEENCIESQEEAAGMLDIIAGEFLPGLYTRASYWMERGWESFDLSRWHNLEVWLAYYVESWYQNGPSGENIDFVVNRVAAQAGLRPVTAIQYTNTIEPQQGMQCCLDARIVPTEAGSGGSEFPASAPAPVISPPTSGESEPAMDAPSPTPNPAFVPDDPRTPWNETHNAGPEEGWTASDAPGEVDRQYAYFRHNDVPVMRFGGSETDENGRSLYPGRVAFLRATRPKLDEKGQPIPGAWEYDYLWMRSKPDGDVYLSAEEGD